MDRTDLLFEEAFRVYRSMLRRTGSIYLHVRFFAAVSHLLHASPLMMRWLSTSGGRRLLFSVWHPGFDLIYSSEKLADTSVAFSRVRFEDVLFSCLERQPEWPTR